MVVEKVNRYFQDLHNEQVLKSPDAIAVICGDEQLTYLELQHRAERLALQLQSLGVKPNSLVGLCVRRSIDMVAGILGILRAGGAYVPLDPEYPRERLSFILADAKIRIVVSHPDLIPVLPADVPQYGV